MTDYRGYIKSKLAELEEERGLLMMALYFLDEADSEALRSIAALPASQQRKAYLDLEKEADTLFVWKEEKCQKKS